MATGLSRVLASCLSSLGCFYVSESCEWSRWSVKRWLLLQHSSEVFYFGVVYSWFAGRVLDPER